MRPLTRHEMANLEALDAAERDGRRVALSSLGAVQTMPGGHLGTREARTWLRLVARGLIYGRGGRLFLTADGLRAARQEQRA